MMKLALMILGMLLISLPAQAEDLQIPMNAIDSSGIGQTIGSITISSSPFGTIFTPDLTALSPGLHGFHVHQNPSCGHGLKEGKKVPGLAAGGHYDPAERKSHRGPYEEGHLGDLPALYVDPDGKATHPILAPRIKIPDLRGRALIIHAHGDNYSDYPKKLGGGGARVACGVIW